MKKLKYPFTFEDWKKHPTTKNKLKWCEKIAKEINNSRKYGEQLIIEIL